RPWNERSGRSWAGTVCSDVRSDMAADAYAAPCSGVKRWLRPPAQATSRKKWSGGMCMRLLRALFGFALALLVAAPAAAEDFPSRPVRLIVAFPAGGPTDFVARLLADRVKDILGQPVLVENKAGANAAIGADYVAKSSPDGYTLFFTTISAVAMNPHMRGDLPYDPVRDFAPVIRMVLTKEVL